MDLRSRWRSFAINALTFVGSIIVTLFALEIAFRFLPVASAPWVEPATAANPIQRYVANTPFTWSVGWNFQNVVRGRTNAQGFVADYDYDRSTTSPLVAVIGDSFIDALVVPFADTITGRLQQAIGPRGRAYAFAQSGAPLSQYVAYAAHACETYRPERLVISIVGNDFDESVFAKRQRNGFFHLHPKADAFDFVLTPAPPMGLLERVARNSALALYVFRNVLTSGRIAPLLISRAHADESNPAPFVGNTSADASAGRVAEGEKVIAWFLDRLANSACVEPKHTVLVIDAMRPEIYDPARLDAARPSYFGRMRTRLLADAAARGFLIVDLEEPFLKSFAKDHRRLESPVDNHWNNHGHAVATEAIIGALTGWSPLSEARTR
jgi:hypothetical protein